MKDHIPEASAAVAELQERGEPEKGSLSDSENQILVPPKDGSPSPEKRRGSKFKVGISLLAVGLAMLLAGVAGVALPASRRIELLTETPFLHLEDAYIQKYEHEFTEAVNKMEEAWNNSDQEGRETFRKYFTPSITDNETQRLEEHIENLRAHVEKLRGCESDKNLGDSKRREYALHLRLLTGVCLATADRLQQVGEMQQENRDSGVPIPIPGHEKLYSFPNLEELDKEAESGMGAKEFLELLKVEPSVSEEELERLPRVDKELADKLVHQLTIEHQRVAHNISALYAFTPFFGVFKGSVIMSPAEKVNYVIPYTGKVFETFTIGKMAERLYPEFPITPYREFERRVRRIARTWSAEVALEEAKKQTQDTFKEWDASLKLKRKLMETHMKKGMPADDLVMYCLFLL